MKVVKLTRGKHGLHLVWMNTRWRKGGDNYRDQIRYAFWKGYFVEVQWGRHNCCDWITKIDDETFTLGDRQRIEFGQKRLPSAIIAHEGQLCMGWWWVLTYYTLDKMPFLDKFRPANKIYKGEEYQRRCRLIFSQKDGDA